MTVPRAVRRVLARDDLIMLAVDADRAVGIVRQREALARRTESEKSLFAVALDHQLRAARDPAEGWATRAQAWKHAAAIVRFGQAVGIPVELPEGHAGTAAEMLAASITQLFDPASPDDEPRDLTLHTFHRYRAARELRLTAQESDDHQMYAHARRWSHVDPETLNGSGAEAYTALLAYEGCVTRIRTGRAAEVAGLVKGLDRYYAETRARGHSTRYRLDLAEALASWELDGTADAPLARAVRRARQAYADPESPRGESAADAPDRGLELLSVLLARAEFLAGTEPAEALELGREALAIAEQARGRWRVIARSRAPLAVVFQRLYGDIALLAAGLPGPGAAELGLRVALSAKQTGFAARIRAGHRQITPEVQRIIDEIIHEEDGARTGIALGRPAGRNLERLRFELREAVSPMLADTVLPPPADLAKLIGVFGDRSALDYLELTDTLADTPNHFRSLIRPGGRVTFERFTPSPYYAAFFTHARRRENLATMLRLALTATGTEPDRDAEVDTPRDREDHRIATAGVFDWARLAAELLPAELVADLTTSTAELVVSAHSWLSLVPWPALRLPSGDRLVERAVVTQTPAFTCLYHRRQPPVAGDAIVRLVGLDEGGVDVTAERAAWGLDAVSAGVPLSRCPTAAAEPPAPLGGSLSAALDTAGRWGFAHIAAHGGGAGLAQRLSIPGEPLSFGRALTLSWPESVLLASCHVGRVLNVTESEPLNLVMGMLSGGARCVVAGITAIDDRGTGRVAGEIVAAIRSGSTTLGLALHRAQLRAAAAHRPEHEWALLGAYVQ